MASSYDGSNLPSLSNYEEAHRFWETAAMWKGRTLESDERVLDSKRKTNVTIRKTCDGSIACKLYNTDVLVYHPDNTTTMTMWASVSTNEFADRLLRWTPVRPYMTRQVVRVKTGGDEKFYSVSNKVEFDRRWNIVSGTRDFEWRVVNRKQANVVLKGTNYKAFCAWVKMCAAMDVAVTSERYPSARTYDVDVKLADREQWPTLVSFKQTGWPDYINVIDPVATSKRVRDLIYLNDSATCYDTHTAPFFTTWSELDRWSRNK